MAQARAFLERQAALLLVARHHRQDDVDDHGDHQGPGVERDHDAFARYRGRGIEDCGPRRERRAVDGDREPVGAEGAAEAGARQEGAHALHDELPVLGVHQDVVDQARAAAEDALVRHAAAGAVGVAAVLQQLVAAAVGLALEDLHQVGVEVHAGLAAGLQHRHRPGEVRVVGVARVEAARAQAEHVVGAVRGGRDGLGGRRAAVAVLPDLAHASHRVSPCAGAGARRATLRHQRRTLVEWCCAGAGQGSFVGPAVPRHFATVDDLGAGSVDAPVSRRHGAAAAGLKCRALVDPDVGLDLVHRRALEGQRDGPARCTCQRRAADGGRALHARVGEDRGRSCDAARVGVRSGDREALVGGTGRQVLPVPVGVEGVATDAADRTGVDRCAELELVVAVSRRATRSCCQHDLERTPAVARPVG